MKDVDSTAENSSSGVLALPAEAVRFIDLQASELTRRAYRYDLIDLARHLAVRGRDLAQADERDAIAWRESLEKRPVHGRIGVDATTLYRKMSVARGFYNHLKEVGGVTENPFAALKTPEVDRRQGRTPYHPKREVEQLLGAIPTSTPRGLRDRAIALLLFANGLRVSEVANLTRSQMGEEDGFMILWLPGKGNRVTKTTLRPEVREVLEAHLAKNVPHGQYVFRAAPRNTRWFEKQDRDPRTRPMTTHSIWKMLKRAARAAGLNPEQMKPHCGRVFFITEAYKETRDLERVSRSVGHSELNTTRGYLRYLDGAAMHPALAVKLNPKPRSM